MTTSKITGSAYGRPASIEVTGDTVMWRAKPDASAENIVTTIHDIKAARWSSHRTSWPGIAFAGLGVVWLLSETLIVAVIAFAIAAALIGRRFSQPRRTLMLECGSMQLVLEVDADSASTARGLVQRIDRAIRSGEVPASPPTLP